MQVDALEVTDGKVILSPTKLSPVAGEFGWSTKLEALEISPAGMRSASKQRLVLVDLALRWGRMEPSLKPRAFASLKSGVVELVPDKLRELWFVESLVLDAPHFEFTPENGPWFDKVVSEPVKPLPNNPEPTWWRQLQFGSGGVLSADVSVVSRLTSCNPLGRAIGHFCVLGEVSGQPLVANSKIMSLSLFPIFRRSKFRLRHFCLPAARVRREARAIPRSRF